MIDRHVTPKDAARATGYSVDQLYGLNQKGVLTVVKINSRVFRFIESELESLAPRISAYQKDQARSVVHDGIDLETERGLIAIFGNVPGVRA